MCHVQVQLLPGKMLRLEPGVLLCDGGVAFIPAQSERHSKKSSRYSPPGIYSAYPFQ